MGVYDTSIRPMPVVGELLALLKYRDFLWQMIVRSIKTRYKRSFLGVAWTMLMPLLTMGVLTLVFSHMFRFEMENYALFVLSGLLAWNFFAQSTTSAIGDLIWSGNLMSRVYVPKSVFAVAAIGTGLVNLGLSLLPYVIICILLRGVLGATILLLPLIVLLTAMFALGVGLLVSAVAVYFPDVTPMYEVLLSAWMYLTPTIYPFEMLPQELRRMLYWNPMVHYVEIFRSLLFRNEIPDSASWWFAFLAAVIMFGGGWVVFTRKANEYAYRI